MKNNILKNYIKKRKHLLFLKKQLYIFKCFKKKKIDIEILNNLIIQQNNKKENSIKIFNLLNILKKNKNKSNKSYRLLLKFEKWWKKLNTKFLLNKYVDTKTIYIWLAYALNQLLYFNYKKTKKFSYKLTENNLYIKLAETIKNNIDNILNKYYTEKITKSLLNKIANKKIYYIITNRILKTCFKAGIMFRKKKKFKKKTISYIILNKNIFEKLIKVKCAQSIQLPNLIPIKYDIKDNISINNNINYTFHYNSNYLDAINYLNNQEIIINKEYFNYLCSLKSAELLKFSEGKINLNILKKKSKKKKNLNKKILLEIFITTMYIIDKYKKYSFYFQYKNDKRGRLYQKNWPMNSLYTKILSPLFIFKQDKQDYALKPNFDNHYWYKSYTLNKKKVLSIRDATNSIFQIAGCILLDEQMLKYSNIHNEDTRYSIYDYLLEVYKLNIDDLIDKIQKIYMNIIHENYIEKIKNIDRKFFKKIIMTWCYNESYKSSVKKIYEYIFLNKKKKWVIQISEKNNQEIKKIYWKISQYIHKNIFNIFKDKFKPYIKLKKLFGLIAKNVSLNNENIIIKHSTNNTHYFQQHHYEKINKKMYIETLWKKKKIIYINEINESKLSIKDNKRSLAPNIIQYLDSVIAVELNFKCKEKNIPIITNHDCFYTTLNNDNNILNIYNKILKKLFIEHNFLEDLLITNKLFNNDKIKSIYKTLNNRRKKNIEKIKKIFDNDIKYSISIKPKKYE